jgi:hypothetical protein
MIRSYDMGYISTRMMESEDAFSDMGSLKQSLELPPEYAYNGEHEWVNVLPIQYGSQGLNPPPHRPLQMMIVIWMMQWC